MVAEGLVVNNVPLHPKKQLATGHYFVGNTLIDNGINFVEWCGFKFGANGVRVGEPRCVVDVLAGAFKNVSASRYGNAPLHCLSAENRLRRFFLRFVACAIADKNGI